MFSDTLLPFLATATVLTVTPGLDTAMVIQSAATQGVKQGQYTSLGIALGCLCWGSAAAIGLGSLMKGVPLAFDLLRAAGAIYLAWLGVRLLVRPRRLFVESRSGTFAADGISNAVRTGFLTNILNPKVGIFYLTLLPQFVPRGDAGWHAFALASTHVAMALAWFVFLSALTGEIAPWLRRPRVIETLDRLTGSILIALALQLSLMANTLG